MGLIPAAWEPLVTLECPEARHFVSGFSPGRSFQSVFFPLFFQYTSFRCLSAILFQVPIRCIGICIVLHSPIDLRYPFWLNLSILNHYFYPSLAYLSFFPHFPILHLHPNNIHLSLLSLLYQSLC